MSHQPKGRRPPYSMCLDFTKAQWSDHSKKHAAPPHFKDKTRAEIDSATHKGNALYYPGVMQHDLEAQALKSGLYVRPGSFAKVCKILEFNQAIGASEGESTKFVLVEYASGTFHGRPISPADYERRRANPVKCCEE